MHQRPRGARGRALRRHRRAHRRPPGGPDGPLRQPGRGPARQRIAARSVVGTRTRLVATAFGLNAAWEAAHWPLYECVWWRTSRRSPAAGAIAWPSRRRSQRNARDLRAARPRATGQYFRHGAAMESNHPSVGLPRPAGFEDRMGHQTPAAPWPILGGSYRRSSAGPSPRAPNPVVAIETPIAPSRVAVTQISIALRRPLAALAEPVLERSLDRGVEGVEPVERHRLRGREPPRR